jgi:hypothetical protein
LCWADILENYNTTSNSKSLTILTIQEVSLKIKKKDLDATRKWLEKREIPIYKDNKPHYVYEVDVDCEIDKTRVRTLRNKYPNNWEEIYRKIARDNSVYEMVVLSLGGEVCSKPTSKIKLQNDNERELYKRYSA